MRKAVILKHGGGELANQLWNYISVYAYGLDSKVPVQNPSFFEYHRYFRHLKNESLLTRLFSYWFQGKVRRRGHPINKWWRRMYSVYARIIQISHSRAVCSSENSENNLTYLPPTTQMLSPNASTVFFTGWLFRNPKGLEIYREELRQAFLPSIAIQSRVDALSSSLRNASNKVIGIHLRQGDYAIFKNGQYLITPVRIREIVDEYCKNHGYRNEEVQLFIASDGPVPAEAFSGYKTTISKENAITDLFTLAHTDVIIGSNSSFGHFSSWYGNISHIVAQTGPMDWEYYADKKSYFPNKYATLAHV